MARALELRAAGWTVDAIKRELRVGSTKVGAWLSGHPPPSRTVRPRAKDELRQRALELRREGRSYREIGEAVPVSTSTLSSWLRDVPLTDAHRAHLDARRVEGSRSRAVAIRAARVRRTERIQADAASEIGRISDRDLFLLGVATYWAEGKKSKPWSVSAGVTLINSDPQLITLFLTWLRLLEVTEDRLVFRLSIHESADVHRATAFWSEVVGVDPSAFRRPSLKRHNPKTARHNTGDGYVGCLVVTVRRSTDLNRRIAGWWAGVATGVDAIRR